MGASGLIEPAIAVAVLAAYLLVAAEIYLATHTVGIFRLSFGGFGPTELRIVLAAGGFYVAGHPWIDIAGLRVRLLDVSGLIAIAGLMLVFVASAVRNARALVPGGAAAVSGRYARFLAIGLAGFLVQLGALWALTAHGLAVAAGDDRVGRARGRPQLSVARALDVA